MPKTSSIRPVVSIQYRLVTDRRMDSRTRDDSIYGAGIASRGKLSSFKDRDQPTAFLSLLISTLLLIQVARCSRVVSALDSGAEGFKSGFKSQPSRCRVSLTQTVHTHRAYVHQAAKLVAALLRIATVTAGLAESNVSPAPDL